MNDPDPISPIQGLVILLSAAVGIVFGFWTLVDAGFVVVIRLALAVFLVLGVPIALFVGATR